MTENKIKIMEENKNNIDNSSSYNRKNVNKIKKIIILLIMILCLIPVLFCIFLLVKIQKLENKMDAMLKVYSENSITSEISNNTEEVTNQEPLEEGEIDVSEKEALNLQKNLTKEASEASEASEAIIASSTEETNKLSVEELSNLNGKKVYLTFDDGPSIYTSEILEILKEYNVKATFFVIGKEKEYYNDYIQIVEEGHTLGMHSYTHSYNEIYNDIDSFTEDIDNLHTFLYNLTGVDCKYYRFPGGSSNLVSNVKIEDCIEYLNDMDYIYYDWNSLNGDAVSEQLTPDQLINNVMKDVRCNEGDSIVLMHDISTKYETVESLPMLIEILQSEGYEICAIDKNTPLIQHIK